MIVTVTLNPAIDKTINIDNFMEGKVNRVSGARIDIGGKGINASKVINKLGGKSIVLGFVAGKNGDTIIEYLNDNGIQHDLIKTKGETRTNIKIVDKIKGLVTDINEKGQSIRKDEVRKLKERILNNLSKGDIIVFSGSVPPGVKNNIYKELIELSKSKGAKTILDADGQLLVEGIKAKPYLIKPNIHELEKAFSRNLNDNISIVNLAKEIVNGGVENVYISMGEKGSIFVNKDTEVFIDALDVEVKNTVGAGDALVASVAFALEKGYDLKKALKLSTAAATLSVMSEGTQIGNIKDIEKLENKVKLNIYSEVV
ncbi:MAG: 1-phosphofructokinase [Candidatus Petromonas sp.]|jgi:1-phosphofructokinase|nr:1-phosphofructokinase [Candidatus Petromonas sp.]